MIIGHLFLKETSMNCKPGFTGISHIYIFITHTQRCLLIFHYCHAEHSTCSCDQSVTRHTREKTDPNAVIYLGNPYSQPVQAKVKNPTRQSKTQNKIKTGQIQTSEVWWQNKDSVTNTYTRTLTRWQETAVCN